MTAPLPTAARSAKAWILFALVFAAGLALDLWSKSAVFGWLLDEQPQSASREIIPGVLRFTLSTNPGIVFGLRLAPIMVIAASVLAVAVVVYFFATSPRGSTALHVALGMILAGALGNLHDRLFSDVDLPGREAAHRQVRDFIDFGQVHYPWIFNIADVLLVVGVGLLVLSSYIYWQKQVREETRRHKQAAR